MQHRKSCVVYFSLFTESTVKFSLACVQNYYAIFSRGLGERDESFAVGSNSVAATVMLQRIGENPLHWHECVAVFHSIFLIFGLLSFNFKVAGELTKILVSSLSKLFFKPFFLSLC